MAPPSLTMRQLASDVNGVKNTFSSWDACMSESYCKYPVIVGIIIVSLILFSVLFCIFRCICCGVECCADCARCCTCCCRGGNSNSRGRDRGSYVKAPNQPTFQQPQPIAYQPTYQPQGFASSAGQPQFARFETPSRQNVVHEDSLPAMPTWDNSTTHHIEDHDAEAAEHVEMSNLHPQDTKQPSLPSVSPIDAAGAAGMATSRYGRTPSPYNSPNPQQQRQQPGGYGAPQQQQRPPYQGSYPSYGSSNGGGAPPYSNGPYSQNQGFQGQESGILAPAAAAAGAGAGAGYNFSQRRSPQPRYASPPQGQRQSPPSQGPRQGVQRSFSRPGAYGPPPSIAQSNLTRPPTYTSRVDDELHGAGGAPSYAPSESNYSTRYEPSEASAGYAAFQPAATSPVSAYAPRGYQSAVSPVSAIETQRRPVQGSWREI